MFTKRSALIAAAVAAVPLSPSVHAADRFWTGAGDGATWTDAANWDGGATIPNDGDNILFPDVASGQTVDTIASRVLGTLTFGAADAYTVNNNALTLGGVTTQNGAGVVTVGSNIVTNTGTVTAQVFNGTGGGLVTFLGTVSGNGEMNFNSANWRLSNAGNSFSGNINVNAGAFLEAAGTSATPNVNISTGATSYLGNGVGGTTSGALTINGGTLKVTGGLNESVTPPQAGQITVGRTVNFGANGGLLDLRQANGSTLGGGTANVTLPGGTSQTRIGGGGGQIPVNTTNGGATSTIRFNGGTFGLSDPTAAQNWNDGGNALRFGAMTGTGPLRIEVDNGAMVRTGNNGGGNVTTPMPWTIAGPSVAGGGDPSSGPQAAINSGSSRTTARVSNNQFSVNNFANGLFFEGAVQIGNNGAARAYDGNITLRGVTSGNPAYVAFAGRSTGQGLGNAFQVVGATSGGSINALYLGQGGDDTLTIEDGAIGSLDVRIRSDQNNHHTVVLDARTVIDAGGTLRFTQSLSNASLVNATTLATNANVGYHEVRNNITGQGTTAKESNVELFIPFANTSTTGGGTNALGGVNFTPGVNLVVNGGGLGGLKVSGLSRPNLLFASNGATVDPVANNLKVDNLLSAGRLAALTGSGGYLTPAAQGVNWNFPIAAEWAANVPVGLKVIDSNTNGADVTLPASGTWGHNLHVADGARLVANSVTLTTGLTSGGGTIEAGGTGVTFGAGSVVNPGSSPGILNVEGGATFATGSTLSLELDGTTPGTGYDQLNVTGAVNLTGGGIFATLGFTPAQGTQFTVVLNDGSDPVNGTFLGLPEGAPIPSVGGGSILTISYVGGDGNDVVLTSAVPEPTTLGALGVAGALVTCRRRRRA